MSKKLSKKDLKRPDQFQAELIKGFEWTTAHSKAVISLIAVCVVLGAAYGFYSHSRSAREESVQEKYYSIERQYNEKKAAFDKAQMPQKDSKAAPAIVATGDLEKDYGPVVTAFEALIKEDPQTRGGQMAALNLSDLYLKYKKPAEAARVLDQVLPGLGGSDMLKALVLNQSGSVFADQGDCQKAIAQWQKILDDSSLGFAQDEARLRMGLCYESLNNPSKAEEFYTEVGKKEEGAADSSAAHDAEKYLRLLKMKTQQAGKGS